jgi:NADPH-dependent 2,4-dienoyl-CoA reductase/sulfur reductase-like enzyme
VSAIARRRLGEQVHALAVWPEDGDDLSGLIDDAHPVRRPGAELGGLAGCEHEVLRAEHESQPSADIVLLTDGPAELDADERARLERAGVRVDERPVASVRGRDGVLEAVLFADGDELARDALLVSAPLRQRTSLATDLGAELTERGTVDVDAFGQTTVPGLYAAGDVSAAMQQVAGAIADGARAAGAINDSLLAEQHGIDPMIPRRDAAPMA